MQPKKPLISILLFLIGAVFVIYGQSLVDGYPYEKRIWMLIPVAFGIALVFLGVWNIEKGTPRWMSSILAWTSSHSIKEWQLTCLVLSLPTAIIVPFAAGTGPKMTNLIVAISAWFIAIGLFLAGTWIQPAPLRWPSWRLVVLALGLTSFAFLLRAILADRIPIMLTGDEAAAGIAAEDFTRGVMNNIFVTSWFAFPSFFFTIPAFFIGVLGHTTEALRIPSALAGALTVTASFFVARAMFGNRVAWFTAVFLAVLHYQIHFSRIGLNNIWDGLWYIVTIGALWYGMEKDRRNAYILAGLSLGISQYFYSSSHTLVVVVLAWVVLIAILDRPRLKTVWVNLILLFMIAGIIALPLALYYVKFPNTFMEPLSRVALTPAWLKQEAINTGIPAWKIVLKQAGLAIGSYTYEPLRAWYKPNVPLLRPFAASLFLIGINLLVLRKKKWTIIPIMLWLLAFIAIGGLSESTPAAQRLVAASPACALLVGLGLGEGTELLERAFDKGRRWIAVIAILLVVILAIDELNFYFRVYTPNDTISEARSSGVIAQTLVNYLEAEPKDTQVLFFGFPNMGYYSIPSTQYLIPDIKGFDINEAWPPAEMPDITSNHLLFVFLPNNLEQIHPVQVDFPGGKLNSFQAADGNLLYEIYKVTTSP